MYALFTSSLALEDEQVYLVIDPEYGAFNTYSNETSFNQKEEPLYHTKLINIFDIRPTRSDFMVDSQRAYFVIYTTLDIRRFYVESEE